MNEPQEVLVTEVGRFRDGGTIHYRNAGGLDFFLDNRIQTKTKGAVYDRHPSAEGAQRLNVKLIPIPKEISINT